MQPIRVSFDTNAYSSVTRPQLGKIVTTGWWPLTRARILSKKRRLAWWYIQWCIGRGRLRAGIPEAAFAAEVLPNANRIDLQLATGTPRAADPQPITSGRRELIREAFALGFRAQRGGRIGKISGLPTTKSRSETAKTVPANSCAIPRSFPTIFPRLAGRELHEISESSISRHPHQIGMCPVGLNEILRASGADSSLFRQGAARRSCASDLTSIGKH